MHTTKLLLVKTAIITQTGSCGPALSVVCKNSRIGIGVVPCNIGCEGFARPTTKIRQNKTVIQYNCRLLIHAYIHTPNLSLCVWICIYIYISIDRYVCLRMCIYICVCVCVCNIYIYTACINMYICRCVPKREHTVVDTYVLYID